MEYKLLTSFPIINQEVNTQPTVNPLNPNNQFGIVALMKDAGVWPEQNNTLLDDSWFKKETHSYKSGGPFFVDGDHWVSSNGNILKQNYHYPWKNGKGYTIYNNDGKAYKYNNHGKFIGRTTGKIRLTTKSFPNRQRTNDSQTKLRSERLENQMKNSLINKAYYYNHISNNGFNIPFIPSKAIIINGNYVSTNQLDSLAKYWGMHNANPQLSQYPQNGTKTTRRLNKNEMLGLAGQETNFGATPLYNTQDFPLKSETDFDQTDLLNANYLKNFGSIPAEYYVRDFHYIKSRVNPSTPPLLDAFRYYAQGDYNKFDSNHSRDVNEKGAQIWQNPAIQNWFKLTGKYWVNEGNKLGQKIK